MKQPHNPTVVGMVGVVAALGLLAGCTQGHGKPASSLSTPSRAPATSSAQTNPSAPSSTTATASPSSTAATSAVAAPPTTGGNPLRCGAGELRPSWSGVGNGASGVVYYSIQVTNVGSTKCITAGYFGVSAYSPDGRLITSSDTRDSGLDNSASELTVAPNGSVNFTIGLADNNPTQGGTACGTVVGALHLIPPNDTNSNQLATPLKNGGFPPLCQPMILVGPAVAGAPPSP